MSKQVNLPAVHDADATGSGARDNVFRVGHISFEAMSDRVLIQEDEFRSGYECKVCEGSGRIPCVSCEGTGKSRVIAEARCSECQGEKTICCGACGGKGGTLVVPEVTERRPTSGHIVSCGPNCSELGLGQSVLYSNFAGHVMDLERLTGGKIVLRILHEKEILCRISGHLELRTVSNPPPG